MEGIHIAALRPDLDALESKQIRAVVTLIWPYSSSQRQFALLLAEPDFRLRRKKGQVRARFSSTSARALATTGVGIGDEVVLSLHGAQFVQEGAVSTPGKSLDWELAYTQTVAVSVRRNGAKIADIELADAAPTPVPRSPVRKQPAEPSPIPQWSSPAFLKRARLSDGPIFEQPAYDPLADESKEGHDKKRRRKSYRDWKAWTYTARTPSPEKEDVDVEDELDDIEPSPSRPTQLPKTPISPSRTEPLSVAAEPLADSEDAEEATEADSAEGDTTVDDGELQKVSVPIIRSPERPKEDAMHAADNYDLYAGPKEDAPLDSQFDFGGDTELNTEDEGDTVDNDAGSPTELATEVEDEHDQTGGEPEAVTVEPNSVNSEVAESDTASETEEGSLFEDTESDQTGEVTDEVEDTTIDETMPEPVEPSIIIDGSPALVMPPPSLPLLHTDFTAPMAAGSLTHNGREPSSPTLKPIDSATLPLPSPFPGEHATSYLDYISVDQEQVPLNGLVAEEPEPDSNADYILENSFFSSISSSKAGGLHQDHETAFTPVRFTFGMDGAGWSRPLELSSPPPGDVHLDAADDKDVSLSLQDNEGVDSDVHVPAALPEQTRSIEESPRSSLAGTIEEEAVDALKALRGTADSTRQAVQPMIEAATAKVLDVAPENKISKLIVLSSDVEADESEEEGTAETDTEQSEEEETEPEVDVSDDDDEYEEEELSSSSQVQEEPDATNSAGQEVDDTQHRSQEDQVAVGTQTSAAVSEVVDLGSPSTGESSTDDEDNDVPKAEPIQINIKADVKPVEDIDGIDGIQQETVPTNSQDKPVTTTAPQELEDFIAMDIVQEPPTTVESSSPTHSIREPASIAIPDTFEKPLDAALHDWEPQLAMGDSLPFVQDCSLPSSQMDDLRHADVKVESVEDGSLYLTSQPETQEAPPQSTTDSSAELRIGVPEEGHKLGELQLKSVPATGPARNTRSKAKTSSSPLKEDRYLSRLSMQSTRTKASFDSTNRVTVSPPRTRTRTGSTATPTQDATQTSPYSLRSQSKHPSPSKSTVVSDIAPVRKTPRKLVQRNSDFDIVPSQQENRDLFGSMFEPSQELGFSQASQGRYSDVAFVKDSEEDTSHSEDSLSTVQYSDTWVDAGLQTYTNLSDPVETAEKESVTPQIKPLPASVPVTQHQTHEGAQSRKKQILSVSPNQPLQSPRKSLRSASSTFSTSPSPRITRTTKSLAQVSSSAPEAIDEELADEVTPKANDQSVMYPILPGEGELRSSPPIPSSASRISHSSSPVTDSAAVQQSSVQQSNLITPDATQQTALVPPLSFEAHQPEQSLLAPQLTQTTSASASLRSFDIPLPGIHTQPALSSPPARISPRPKSAATDITSSSPTRPSSDAADGTALVSKPNLPSVGLSTPLAYYTPLHDLIYFLNRSSQFHSSSNPDILALCTSPSTPPSRAAKGPRHWTTTLHITDLSTHPAVTTVQVFRAYENALPVAQAGDVVLLRAFAVKSVSRQASLRSEDESSWCVWRFGLPCWGAKKGRWAQLRAREEVRGPAVERGEGEWAEVERLRSWYSVEVKARLEEVERERESGKRETRGSGKEAAKVEVEEVGGDE